MTIDELNALTVSQATDWFIRCCASRAWAENMQRSRPYTSIDDVINTACKIWSCLSNSDFLEAFKAHPMIGDINTLEAKFANTSALAEQEQASAIGADSNVLQELHRLNHLYLAQNGFIFIICATGQSAENMLASIEQRIHNDTETEIKIAAEQQLKITILRIQKGLTA
ncbi:2-oxo-4-hydroxy-4-carboxy-5-ureidoimidazoline decarboxylase [Aliiglaciecola lipolytica]|uniref:2-oxo-4-hydroxy-4-carboxy-5-ureidoimidazoline decarboxylase n=1 Tax=Aliiglaciecola lipolytica E3 TaxID=1127673 RepID=K6XSS0_9ALTE|nr:2-oxo-4-hydroxy-4-carboxy-5-ureidoimidazoline decarboxylase [Aliiglaciecola lipolytica]GAC14726.1 hypothetical protein GLIP_2098 [Aliiglaciecola lipolytica E3]